MAKKLDQFELALRAERADKQISELKVPYDYDTKDYPIGVLVSQFIIPGEERALDNTALVELYVPAYQRAFIWDIKRQSRFIESILLELPVPPIFAALDKDNRLEIVDGRQRMQTLTEFRNGRLQLRDLNKLTQLNSFRFSDLSTSRQRKFLLTDMRIHILTERSTSESRQDIFNRLNTGASIARASEVRKGSLPGPFFDFILRCCQDLRFTQLCPINDRLLKRGEDHELVLRFFAYSQRHDQFKHDVAEFLTDYLQDRQYDVPTEQEAASFFDMLDFVGKYFPNGFAKDSKAKTTPRVRFEAISLGVHLALKENPDLVPADMSWLYSPEFVEVTTSDAANNLSKFKRRFEYVRSKLLGV